MVTTQHVPLRDVAYRRLRGHSKDQGSGPPTPVTPANNKITCFPGSCSLSLE